MRGMVALAVDARVEIWQSDVYGRYLPRKDGAPGQRDPNPAYFGGQRVRDALSVTLYPADGAEPGARSARFDIVVVPAR